MLILALYQATRAEEWRLLWFEGLVAHHNDLVASCEGASSPPPALLPPIDLNALPDETLAGQAPLVLKGMRDAVVAIALQAYATAELLEEFSGELGGADPLRPEAREYLEETEERLARLIGKLEIWTGPIERGDAGACKDELGRAVATARRRE